MLENRRVVFTNGCFDVLHYGHFKLLEYCRNLAGDGKVVVGLNSDQSVRKLKGDGRPHNPQQAREFALKSIKYVDEVVVFDENTPLKLIENIKPDFIVKGGDYKKEDVVGSHISEIKIFNSMEGYSSTSILNKLK